MNRLSGGFAVVTSLVANSAAMAALVNSSWAAPGSGNWNTAANWNPATVPNNGGGNTYAVTIDPGGARLTVTANLSTTIESLSVLGDGILSIANGQAMTIREGPIDIDYAMFIQGAGSSTDLVIGKSLGGSVVSLTGAGQLQLFSDSSRIYGAADTNRLVNESLLIKGRGQIGVNLMRLTNKAEIRADAVNAALTMDPRDGVDGVINEGLMRATDGGVLRLQNGTFSNPIGTIRAEIGSRVELSNATVQGGTIRVDSGGTLQVNSSTGGYLQSGLSLEQYGFVGIYNDAELRLYSGGTFENAGLLRVQDDGGGGGSYLRISGDVELAGGGEVELWSSGNNYIQSSATALDRLTNVDNTIRGRGYLCNDFMRFTNLGEVRANTPSQNLIVNPADGDRRDHQSRADGGERRGSAAS
jgi:hypothetical protein